MTVFPPGTELEVLVDDRWLPATVVRGRIPHASLHWPDLDPARAVFLDTDDDGVFDVVVHDGRSDQLRIPRRDDGRADLRAVGSAS